MDMMLNEDNEFNLQDCYRVIAKIEEAKQIIDEKGGKLLNDEHAIDMLSKFVVQCGNGHTWKTSLQSLKRGYWCSICAHVVSKEKIKKISSGLKKFYSTKEGINSKFEGMLKRSETMAIKREETIKNLKEKIVVNAKKRKMFQNLIKARIGVMVINHIAKHV